MFEQTAREALCKRVALQACPPTVRRDCVVASKVALPYQSSLLTLGPSDVRLMSLAPKPQAILGSFGHLALTLGSNHAALRQATLADCRQSVPTTPQMLPRMRIGDCFLIWYANAYMKICLQLIAHSFQVPGGWDFPGTSKRQHSAIKKRHLQVIQHGCTCFAALLDSHSMEAGMFRSLFPLFNQD